MKKIIGAILLMLMFFINVEAQVVKFKAHHYSYRVKNGHRWGQWSPYERVSILFTIDGNNRVIIYSNQQQGYDVIKIHPTTKDPLGNERTKYECINDNGVRCNLYINQYTSGTSQLEVEFSDINYKYSYLKV